MPQQTDDNDLLRESGLVVFCQPTWYLNFMYTGRVSTAGRKSAPISRILYTGAVTLAEFMHECRMECEQ